MTEAVTAPPAPAAPAPGATAAPVAETPQTPETPAERTFTQKELNEIVEGRLAKQRKKYEPIEQERNYWRDAAIGKGKPEQQPAAKPATQNEPKREDFDTYEAFIEARAEWRADRKVEERFQKQEKDQKDRTAAEESQKRGMEFKKRTTELAKDIKDFAQVMADATGDPDSPVSRLFAEPLEECENPAAVLYHLAKNPDDAERIASLPGHKQAREIWALDARLKSAPAPTKPSSAPEPIKPVGGKTVKGDDMPDPILSGGKVNPAYVDWRNRKKQ